MERSSVALNGRLWPEGHPLTEAAPFFGPSDRSGCTPRPQGGKGQSFAHGLMVIFPPKYFPELEESG